MRATGRGKLRFKIARGLVAVGVPQGVAIRVAEVILPVRKASDGDETVGQLYDRVVQAGGELHAYGYRFWVPGEEK